MTQKVQLLRSNTSGHTPGTLLPGELAVNTADKKLWYGDGSGSPQDMGAGFLGTLLAGLSTATNAAISTADSALSALGKLQAQITNLLSSATVTPAGGSVARTLPVLLGEAGLSVKSFGAVGNGTTDDTAAINNAIAALGAGGGVVLFPPGTYKVTSSITVGNGTVAAASTRQGVILRGTGHPGCTVDSVNLWGYSTARPTRIVWGGATSGNGLIQIVGPMVGWGVENLSLDGASNIAHGVRVISAQFGSCSSLSLQGFTDAAIYLSTWPHSGSGSAWNIDCLHNSFKDIFISVPAILGAKGFVLTGASDGTSNTDFNDISNLTIFLPLTILAVYGLYLQSCDSNSFRNIHFFGEGTGPTCVVFDYTVANSWPASNVFYSIDTGGAAIPFMNLGSPGPSARPNIVYGLIETNGAVVTPMLNLVNMFPQTTSRFQLLNQTASIAQTALWLPWQAGLVRISTYLVINGSSAVGGTVTPSVHWNDGVADNNGIGPAAAAPTVGSVSQSVFLAHTAAAAINYQVDVAGITSGTTRFDLYITVERLT